MNHQMPLDRATERLAYQVHMMSRPTPPTFRDEAREALQAALDVDEIGRVIWETSRADEGTISATGARIIARAICAHLLDDVPCQIEEDR